MVLHRDVEMHEKALRGQKPRLGVDVVRLAFDEKVDQKRFRRHRKIFLGIISSDRNILK